MKNTLISKCLGPGTDIMGQLPDPETDMIYAQKSQAPKTDIMGQFLGTRS